MFMIGYIFLLAIAFFVLAFFLGSTLMVGSYILMAILMFAWGCIELKKERDRRKEEDLEETEDFLNVIPHTKKTVSEDLLNSLLIDENNNTFYVAKREYIDESFIYKAYDFSKLLEVAILENGKVKYLFPKDGTIGGNVSDSVRHLKDEEDIESEDKEETNLEEIKKLKLKIVVDDISNHSIEYTFLEKEDAIDKDSDEYKDLYKECTNWSQMISLIINQYKHEKRLIGPWF